MTRQFKNKYNRENSHSSHIAVGASLWFHKKMNHLLLTQEAEWTAMILRTAKKPTDVLSHPPADLDPNGILSKTSASENDED